MIISNIVRVFREVHENNQYLRETRLVLGKHAAWSPEPAAITGATLPAPTSSDHRNNTGSLGDEPVVLPQLGDEPAVSFSSILLVNLCHEPAVFGLGNEPAVKAIILLQK